MSLTNQPLPQDETPDQLLSDLDAHETARYNLIQLSHFYQATDDAMHLATVLQLITDIEQQENQYRQLIYVNLVNRPQQ